MRGKAHSDQTRAAVMAALMAGQSVSEIAGEYKLPEQTVSNWRKKIEPQLGEVRAKKQHDFDELLGDYLGEVLVTLSVQARAFRDPTWLAKQPASEAAVLHGVLTDKAIRLLTARAAAAEAASDSAGEPA